MEIICLQKNIKKALNICERIIGRNLTLPILNNILLSVKNKKIKISSTNLEIGINCWVSGKVNKDGELTVPAKILSSYINNLPNKQIELKLLKDNQLSLKSENYKANFKGLPAKDFPIIPEIKDKSIIKINSDILRTALAQVVGMVSLSDSRPEISGVYLEFNNNLVKLVATDSFRLAEKKLEIKLNNYNHSLILPQRVVQEIIRIIGEEEEKGETEIIINNNQILFNLGYCQIVSRLIDGQYPDYQQIIPKEFKTIFTVNKEELINNVKLASLFSSKINDVKFIINPQKELIEISTKDIDLGENKSQLKAKIQGRGFEVAFNYRYILDGLSNILSDKVEFTLNDNNSPVLIKPIGDKNYTYMVMPIKI